MRHPLVERRVDQIQADDHVVGITAQQPIAHLAKPGLILFDPLIGGDQFRTYRLLSRQNAFLNCAR